jgi:hypothetical protein
MASLPLWKYPSIMIDMTKMDYSTDKNDCQEKLRAKIKEKASFKKTIKFEIIPF